MHQKKESVIGDHVPLKAGLMRKEWNSGQPECGPSIVRDVVKKSGCLASS